MREAEELLEELRDIAYDALEQGLSRRYTEWNQLKNLIKDSLAKYIYQKVKRRPMILPIILDS